LTIANSTARAAPRVVAPLVVAAIALVLGRRALLPGLGLWDTAEFQTVGPVLGTAHPTGYPAYVILGWLAGVVFQPFGDPAFRMNFLSTVLIAAAAGLAVVVVRLLTGRTALGMAAGVGFAATPIAWRIGTRADPHALHIALVAVLLVCLVAWEREHRDGGGDRWLLAASIVFGVSLANHSLTLLLAPPIGLYVLAVDRAILRRYRLVAGCALLVIGTAALLYLELPLRAGPFRAPLVYGDPNTPGGFAYIVLGVQFTGSLVDPLGDLAAKFVRLVDLTVGQFGILAPFVPVAFIATAMTRPRYALLTGSAAFITCFFAASYANADIGRYYLGPLLVAWTWLAILGSVVVDSVVASGSGSEDRGPAAAGSLAAIVGALLLAPTILALPARLGSVDASTDTTARHWVEAVVAALPPNAVVVSWWSFSTPLWYVQRVEHRRPDVTIADDRTRLDEHLGEIRDVIDAHLGRDPVYVVVREDNEMPGIIARYSLTPVAGTANTLLLVTGRNGSAP
jgi:transmembrane protein TMEM260 (protein O-mannosyltransferase)